MSGALVFSQKIIHPKIGNTWPEFLEHVSQAREELGSPDLIWYRGVSRADYKLVPSLLRVPNGLSKEQVLFNEYQRSAARFIATRSNDWESLFDMQHYGIPTRLLDWSDVLGIAIAFALYDQNDDAQDSSIYLLADSNLKCNTCNQVRFADVITSFVLVLSTTSA